MRKMFALIAVVCLILTGIYYNPISSDEIVFIDVGQGASTHVNVGRLDILIDGGGNVNYNVGKNTLKPYLLHNGANDVDLVLMTHLHTDHYQGIVELSESYKVKSIKIGSKAGDKIKLKNGMIIQTIWPLSYDKNSSEKDENKNCSVFIINYKGYKIMITGDLDEEGERAIINKYNKEILKCDILQIGHHGSKYSTSNEFLDVVDPTYAVIQVGKNNYGHPAKETLDRLIERGVKVYRNDINGAVGFKFKPNKIVCHTMID